MSTATNANTISTMNIDSRIDAYAWSSVSEHLDAHGWAMVTKLLTASECEAVAGLYAYRLNFVNPRTDDAAVRANVVGIARLAWELEGEEPEKPRADRADHQCAHRHRGAGDCGASERDRQSNRQRGCRDQHWCQEQE